jgi:hypothetical protein
VVERGERPQRIWHIRLDPDKAIKTLKRRTDKVNWVKLQIALSATDDPDTREGIDYASSPWWHVYDIYGERDGSAQGDPDLVQESRQATFASLPARARRGLSPPASTTEERDGSGPREGEQGTAPRQRDAQGRRGFLRGGLDRLTNRRVPAPAGHLFFGVVRA